MNFTAPTAIRRAERELETLLAACVDYQRLLSHASVPDPVTGPLTPIFTKYNIPVTPRSLYGERVI